jgi:hypothetical protein
MSASLHVWSHHQALIDGKASPYHPLCGSATCYLDRYTLATELADQPITICPLEPRGCRYVEVHVTLDDGASQVTPLSARVELLSIQAMFRCYQSYHSAPQGSFLCPSDPVLERIWLVGSDTTRACVEDSCIDGPCRERGQWTGDTLAVTLPNLACMYDDISPVRLCLLQSSQSANGEGVISGNCPNNTYPVDYALLWFEGAWRYLTATGDLATLSTLLPRATKCMDFFLGPTNWDPTCGFAVPAGCSPVIDWGYTPAAGFPVNLAVNALLLSALYALISWYIAAHII